MTFLLAPFRFEIDETNFQVRREQIRARVIMYPAMILPAMLLAPLLVWLMWGVVAQGVLLGWMAMVLSVHLFELMQWWYNRTRTESIENLRRWDRYFRLHTGLAGIAWGGAWIVMFVPGELSQQALLICVALGLSAGAATINPVHKPSMFIYLGLLVSPLIVRVAMENDRTHWILAVMLLIYISFLLDSAIKLMRTFELSLQQRFENEALLKALHEREEETVAALQKAEQASREKSKFLATASHDLRQPLQALRLFSDALRDVAKQPEALRLSEQIGKSVNSLVEMFDDLLDVSRLDAGIVQPRWQHFSLNDLCERMYVDFAPMAQAKGLQLDLGFFESGTKLMSHDEIAVCSDPFLLERMMRNLISNAVRYTEHGKVSVYCHCSEDEVKVAVQDTGVGIRPEVKQQIFEEYYQVDNPHRDRRKGLGLGLAIVRKVEELLGYHLTVESALGEGSTFSFSIKRGDPQRLVRPFVITEARHDVSGKVIALVEDDDDIREFTAEIMRDWGCKVFAEATGEALLRSLDVAAQRPDLLVCDYRLPDNQTALDVMRQVREFWGEVPVLVITGDTAKETLQAILKSGSNLLHKPVAPARLRSVVYFLMQDAGIQ